MYDHVIERFYGLDQRVCAALSPQGTSPDELNFNTDNGRLTVTKGFARKVAEAVPGAQSIDGAQIFNNDSMGVPAVLTGAKLYLYGSEGWSAAYTHATDPVTPHVSFVQALVGSTDCLLIADGAHRILKYNGQTVTEFGSEQGCSNIACAYLAMYRGRLFAAGDTAHGNRLYYSQLPGDGRTIEDWSYCPASPLVEGGHVDIGSAGGDFITGIFALSNQLIIIKRYSVYRLIGDRPSNFTVERVSGGEENPRATAAAVCGDCLYYLTKRGLYWFNGVEAAPTPDMEAISGLMQNAVITGASMASVGSKVYALISVSGQKRLIEYDVSKRRYLLFGGFECSVIFENKGRLMLVSGSRRLCEWGAGTDFDGQSIEAYWQTPVTYLGDKAAIKSLRELYLTGSGSAVIQSETGGVSEKHRVFLRGETLELPLKNEGRAFCFRISNVNGGALSIDGGLQAAVSVRKRTE